METQESPEWGLPPTLGAIIRVARERKGWSVRQLARRIKRSPSWVSKVERDLECPGEWSFRLLCDALEDGALENEWAQRKCRLCGTFHRYPITEEAR